MLLDSNGDLDVSANAWNQALANPDVDYTRSDPELEKRMPIRRTIALSCVALLGCVTPPADNPAGRGEPRWMFAFSAGSPDVATPRSAWRRFADEHRT
jgi:hypothetical protein